MTDDKMVEVIARALVAWRYNQVLGRGDKIFALWKSLNPDLWANAINGARAAIRACHAAGGLVLREVPEPISIPDSVDVPKNLTAGAIVHLSAVGHNAALAAVRALAVEVGE